MALSSSQTWEVRTTGNDNFGGAFRAGALIAAPTVAGSATTSAFGVAIAAGGSVANATYYVVITYWDQYSESLGSSQFSVVSSGGNQTITVTPPTSPPATAFSYSIYVGTTSGGPYFVNNSQIGIGTTASITTTPATSGTEAPGIDYSQSASAHVVFDGVTIAGHTIAANALVIVTGYTVAITDVGNVVQITGGTNFTTGFYEIIDANVGTNTWTLDRNCTNAAGTGMVGNMGGCLATPGKACGKMVSSNVLWIKAGTYNLTATPNVAGGSLQLPASGSVSYPINVSGYNTTRGDITIASGLTRPLLQSNANSQSLVDLNNVSNAWVANIEAKLANSNTTITSFNNVAQDAICYNCKSTNTDSGGFSMNGGITIWCEVSGATGASYNSGGNGYIALYCTAHGATGSAFRGTGSKTHLIRCLAYGNGGSGFVAQGFYYHCVADSNTGVSTDGFGATGADGNIYVNCISSNNGRYNYGGTAAQWHPMINCASYNPGTADTNNMSALIGVSTLIKLTAGPYTNSAGGDFSLNNTTGGGKLLRDAGFPASFPGLSTNNFLDVGAAQRDASAGGGGLMVQNPLTGGVVSYG